MKRPIYMAFASEPSDIDKCNVLRKRRFSFIAHCQSFVYDIIFFALVAHLQQHPGYCSSNFVRLCF